MNSSVNTKLLGMAGRVLLNPLADCIPGKFPLPFCHTFIDKGRNSRQTSAESISDRGCLNFLWPVNLIILKGIYRVNEQLQPLLIIPNIEVHAITGQFKVYICRLIVSDFMSLALVRLGLSI